jgi:hypothetical protein
VSCYESSSRSPGKQLLERVPVKCTVSQELLWLWDRDSLGIQQRERPSWEAGTRGIMRDSRPRGLSACIVNCRETADCVCVCVCVCVYVCNSARLKTVIVRIGEGPWSKL